MSVLIPVTNGLLLSTTQKKSESNWRSDLCYKFIYSIKGTMDYQAGKQDLAISQGQFLLLNPFEEHRQLKVSHHKFLIELSPSFLEATAASFSKNGSEPQFGLIVQKHPQITQWVQFIHDYIQLTDPGANSDLPLFLEHSFTQLALLLAKTSIGTHQKDIPTQSFKNVQPLLYNVMQALKDDYDHSWTLEEMAKIAHLSKFQFSHAFKETTGISPYSWLQLYRLIRSQQMLIGTNQTVLQIAAMCGFSSVSVYNQLFTRLYGITPMTFRIMRK